MTEEENNEQNDEQEPLENEQPQEEQEPETSLFPCPTKELVEEMEGSYLDYAMSVIVSRALPDVRDGLKPVHRRILFAMHDLGLRSSAKFRKSAAVVGEVLGKYHPHGDTAVYDSMVRMAQDFSLRYPLVLGQGNFGSIDGDNAAAMRYTEAKMQKITDQMLQDIEKDTVEWRLNYDSRLKEPTVLPSKLPQLLLNGTMGIAVGMATNIPPHNLTEVVDATIALIEDSEIDISGLMEHIQGPDLPTAGLMYDREALRHAYATGRGSIAIRGRAEITEIRGGKSAIIINEIPYQVNKAMLVTKIAELVRDKKIMGITDLRDESNREGIRVVIELKKDAFPNKVLNQLYKFTNLQTSFGFNMIALSDKGMQPQLFDLKGILEHFIKHRIEVTERRVQYELAQAEARAHILEGLKKALDHIDEVIATIRAAQTQEDAKTSLMSKFDFSEKQTEAILAMQLRRLAGLERQKILDELAEKLKFIGECKAILADPEKVRNIISEELKEIKEKYGDERRTEIVPHAIGKFSAKDTIPNEDMIVAITKGNYIKRMAPITFKSQNRGGKGIIGASMRDEEDEVTMLICSKNHNDLLFFTNKGRCFGLPVYEIPSATRTAKGQALVNFLQLTEGEFVTALLDVTKIKGEYFFMATTSGTVKKTPVEHFKNVRKSGLIAIKLRKKDQLEWVKTTTGQDEIIIVTKEGKAIRFNESDVRSMGRNASGVRGIRLKGGDSLIEMDTVRSEGAELLVVMENGLGKFTLVSLYRGQKRGGSGTKAANLTTKTGKLVGAKVVSKTFNGDLLILSKKGLMIRMKRSDIPSRGRATQGVILMRMKEKSDKVCSVSMIASQEDMEEAKKQEEFAIAEANKNPIKETPSTENPSSEETESPIIKDEPVSDTKDDTLIDEDTGMLKLDFDEDSGDVFNNPKE